MSTSFIFNAHLLSSADIIRYAHVANTSSTVGVSCLQSEENIDLRKGMSARLNAFNNDSESGQVYSMF